MEDAQVDGDGDSNQVAPALISVHPSQFSATVALGSSLRIFDLQKNSRVSLVDDSFPPVHTDCIRALRYSCDGKILVSGGDDKLVKIWSTFSWRLISLIRSEKRVSAIAVSNDGHFVCFADKFGAVWVSDIRKNNENSLENVASPLLAHYCSIITRLEFSPNGEFIISADRDFKIRVTRYPKNPLNGAHEIQSFCLGHTEFVSCLAFISNENNDELLVSGSGDSTVRIWDFSSGSLLDTLDDFGEETKAITALCAIPSSPLVAVAAQNLKGIALVRCNTNPSRLSLSKVVPVSEGFIPTALSVSSSGERLWMVSGVSKLNGGVSEVARLRVINGFEMNVLNDDEVPGCKDLLSELQGSVSIDEDLVCEIGNALKAALSCQFAKKQYSAENREFRKRTRNDKKQ